MTSYTDNEQTWTTSASKTGRDQRAKSGTINEQHEIQTEQTLEMGWRSSCTTTLASSSCFQHRRAIFQHTLRQFRDFKIFQRTSYLKSLKLSFWFDIVHRTFRSPNISSTWCIACGCSLVWLIRGWIHLLTRLSLSSVNIT